MNNRKTIQQIISSKWLMLPDTRFVLNQRRYKMYNDIGLVINITFF